MSFKTYLLVAAAPVSVLALVVAACGGTVGSVNGGSAGDGGGGGGEGGGGGNGEGGGGSCTFATLPGNRACVPGTARANTPLKLAVDDTEGCLGCFTTFEPCEVTVSGTTVSIAMKTKTCPPPGDQACPAICALPGTTCTIPPLPAGTYTVEVSGDAKRPGLPPRQLEVTDDATASSCKLSQAGLPPAPLDGTKYPASCSVDTECVLVTAGDICSPCRCPNLAIATSAAKAYGADYRAAVSQCASGAGDVACAACAPVKAKCVTSGDKLTGTCEVAPGN